MLGGWLLGLLTLIILGIESMASQSLVIFPGILVIKWLPLNLLGFGLAAGNQTRRRLAAGRFYLGVLEGLLCGRLAEKSMEAVDVPFLAGWPTFLGLLFNNLSLEVSLW
jgi:hypothetical protein